MPRSNKITLRSGSGSPSAASFAVAEPAWDSSAGKLYIKSAAGTMVEIGAGGGGSSSIASYETTAGFPATGSSSVLYIDLTYGKLYRWVSGDSVYAECGAIGGLSNLDGGSYA